MSGAVGRPKVLKKLVPFNTKVQADYKETIDAIVKVGGYRSARELIEEWTDLYLKENPSEAERVKAFIGMMGS